MTKVWMKMEAEVMVYVLLDGTGIYSIYRSRKKAEKMLEKLERLGEKDLRIIEGYLE